ncbi:hypothetical protein GCM10023196_025610 [Actinoallomurus vinaceus]|uniref:Uncharacterized protein n=1 Tax=Actinoallomurus vinaceus TaxID=1080074 RepID=A0ABP8U9R5_9ACTN
MGGAARRFGRTARVWLVSGVVVAAMAATVSSETTAPAPSGLSVPKYVVSVGMGGQDWAQVLRRATPRALEAVPVPSPGFGRAAAVVAAVVQPWSATRGRGTRGGSASAPVVRLV